MGESKGEGGSWLYGLILILAGGLIVVTGLLNALGISFLSDQLQSLGYSDLAAMASSVGYLHIAIGAWGIIGGVGLIKDQEWGWGIALVVLSLVIVTFIVDVILGLKAAIETSIWTDWVLWIKLVALIVAGVGIVYLLMTKEKYA
jgi:hypothetical protein